ncbi:hypothetical protein Tco_0475330 [Tanacetum coccineum]
MRVNLGADLMKQTHPNLMKNGIVKGKGFKMVDTSKAGNLDNKLGEKLIEDSMSNVEDVYDETCIFMASNQKKNESGCGSKSLYDYDYDPYDDDKYNDYDLTEEQTAFCDA